MTEILNIFRNPFGTLVGKKIEYATSLQLESEDWGLNMEICDIINESEEETKNAVRAIKKRLQQLEQQERGNFKSYGLLLSVIETCVNNCQFRFHAQIMTRDFIQDLVKLIGPRNNPPIELQERVLRLIERCAETFKNYPEISGVVTVYNDLKSKGVIFPAREPEGAVDAPRPPPNTRSSSMSRTPHAVQSNPPLIAQPSVAPRPIDGQAYDKVLDELTVIQTSLSVYSSILDQVESKEAERNNPENWTLLDQLQAPTTQMKQRIVELIETVSNEDLTIELLRLNDELNNVYTRHERLINERAQEEASPPLPAASATEPKTSHANETQVMKPVTSHEDTSLIDLDNDETSPAATSGTLLSPIVASSSNHQLHPSPNPFDTSLVSDALLKSSMSFATESGQTSLVDKLDKLRMSDDSKQATAQTSSSKGDVASKSREQDFIEIENWLSNKQPTEGHNHSENVKTISAGPNSDFENFIATRALAGDALPVDQSEPRKQQQQPQEEKRSD